MKYPKRSLVAGLFLTLGALQTPRAYGDLVEVKYTFDSLKLMWEQATGSTPQPAKKETASPIKVAILQVRSMLFSQVSVVVLGH